MGFNSGLKGLKEINMNLGGKLYNEEFYDFFLLATNFVIKPRRIK
jgi:hypothetical protein